MMTNPIFTLEGPEAFCELYESDMGYQLYYEHAHSLDAPIPVGIFPHSKDAIDDAFDCAKVYCGLADWRMDWWSIELNELINDWDEWNALLDRLGKVYSND